MNVGDVGFTPHDMVMNSLSFFRGRNAGKEKGGADWQFRAPSTGIAFRLRPGFLASVGVR